MRSSRSGGFQGIGFAIPSNQAKPIYQSLKEKGKIVRGWLGVQIIDVSKDPEDAKTLGFKGDSGIIVNGVMEKTPAFGKLQPDDIITQLNGKPVKDMQQLRNTIAATAPGTDVVMKVWRDGEDKDVTVKIAEQPENALAMNTDRPGALAPRNNGAASVEALGLKLQTLTDELAAKYELDSVKPGALVTAVAPRSAAARSGLQEGDLITRINRQSVASAKEAADVLAKVDLSRTVVRLAVTNREGNRLVFLRGAAKE